MKNAVVYARYSSERQTEQSIEGQLRVCNDYAERNGLNIVDNYIDRATTGTNDNRPAFQQMLSDCTKPVVWDIVLVYAIDRFGRNSIEIAINKQKLHKNHKTLISATQRTSDNIDGTKNLDGILLENVYIGLAEYYSAELSQKTRRGMNENREKGHFCGGAISYGYRVENKKVIIHEDEAKIVRQIYSQYASEIIAKEIIAELTSKGIYHKGKPFKLTTLYGILRMEKYKGIYRHNDRIYTNMYPAIVDKQLFDTVQMILAKNRIGSRSTYTEYILRNVLYCGYCGKHLVGECGTSRNGEVKNYYKCWGRKFNGVKYCSKEIVRKDELKRDDVIQYLTHGLRQQAKLLISQLIEKIVLYDDKIEIYYRFTDKKNPDHDSDRDLLLPSGSDSSIMVAATGLLAEIAGDLYASRKRLANRAPKNYQ